jgi:hypothetical protein
LILALDFILLFDRSADILRPNCRLVWPPRAAARSMTAPLGPPEGLSLTAASTVAGLIVAVWSAATSRSQLFGWCRIISDSKGERIGIVWGTSFFDAGAMRFGIHESPIS